MTTTQLVSKIEALPIPLKKAAEKYIESLVEKAKREMLGRKKNKKPVFGCAKGEFKLSDDFNEPLEDFKEYM